MSQQTAGVEDDFLAVDDGASLLSAPRSAPSLSFSQLRQHQRVKYTPFTPRFLSPPAGLLEAKSMLKTMEQDGEDLGGLRELQHQLTGRFRFVFF